MTQDDKEFLKEFLQGFGGASIIFIGLCLVLSYIVWASGSNTETETDKSQSTKVVGTYKDCDIIQWHYGPLAEYKYFLHCPKYQDS